ncbi:hypothetical protein BDM02DRAFT_3116638 [Thelephora ganbajun]|uniref:Uncharacterized protein n=1 Tax=Thelephora ganbajun TaxID=370292 RepID=A0ACB6ZDK6_THEGA|nr:hypothetical protein BDM02DRAFT_3116638 [Thelephora ganbajun]
MICTLFGGSDRRIHSLVFSAFDSVRILDAQVETKNDVTIGGCGGVVYLIYDNHDCLQSCQIIEPL